MKAYAGGHREIQFPIVYFYKLMSAHILYDMPCWKYILYLVLLVATGSLPENYSLQVRAHTYVLVIRVITILPVTVPVHHLMMVVPGTRVPEACSNNPLPRVAFLVKKSFCYHSYAVFNSLVNHHSLVMESYAYMRIPTPVPIIVNAKEHIVLKGHAYPETHAHASKRRTCHISAFPVCSFGFM